MAGGLGETIRKGVNMVHGTGEAIRGSAMSEVDKASGDTASATKNQAIADKGVAEWDQGYRGHPNHAPAGNTSTNYGSHNSNMANKLDPRFDSDTDHRGTVNNSTNAGPHSTNVGNKLDPRFDSDTDHRADPTSAVGDEKDFAWNPSRDLDDNWYSANEHQHGSNPPHEHRGSIGASSGLEAANKLDPVFPVGPDAESMKYTDHPAIHRLRGSISGGSGLQAAQKLDPPTLVPPRADEVSARGPGYDQPDPPYDHPKPTHQSSVLNMLDPEIDIQPSDRAPIEPISQYNDDNGKGLYQGGKQNDPGFDTELKRQPRRRSQPNVNSAVSGVGPRSTSNPHKSDLLNMLDPRVDNSALKREGWGEAH